TWGWRCCGCGRAAGRCAWCTRSRHPQGQRPRPATASETFDSILWNGRSVRLLARVEVVQLHAIAQLVALQVEHLGGARLIPVGSIRGAQDQGALQLLDKHLERYAAGRHGAGDAFVDE